MKEIIYILLALLGIILLLQLGLQTEVRVGVQKEGGPTIELDVSSLSKLKEGPIVVYFKPSQENLAQEVAQTLRDSLQLVLGRLGITVDSLLVALFQKEDLGGITSASFIIKQQEVWPLFVSRTWRGLQDGDPTFQLMLYWVMPHEAIEGVIAVLLYHDRQARWIGDGLAEYAGYIVTKKSAPSVIDPRLSDLKERVTKLLEAGQATYDLTKSFQVRSGLGGAPLTYSDVQRAGYSVALAFWLNIAQRHGEETIRKFWTRLSALRTWCLIPGLLCIGPNARDAARILSELTGEDIWAKLQNMDLHEVLQTLEQAARP